jgi:hypothetical protein
MKNKLDFFKVLNDSNLPIKKHLFIYILSLLDAKTQELELLTGYFGEKQLTASVLAWFEVYKPIIEWWITLWAWTQLANHANAVDLAEYKKLTDHCYKKTLSFLNSSEYKQALTLIEEEKDKMPGFSTIRLF